VRLREVPFRPEQLRLRAGRRGRGQIIRCSPAVAGAGWLQAPWPCRHGCWAAWPLKPALPLTDGPDVSFIRPRPWSAAAWWRLRVTAWSATRRQAVPPMREAWGWRRRSAPSTPPTSRPTTKPASAAGLMRPSSAPCATASTRMDVSCIRPSRTRPSPSSAMAICRPYMAT
jgi:nicotinate dehydrogenase subunit B